MQHSLMTIGLTTAALFALSARPCVAQVIDCVTFKELGQSPSSSALNLGNNCTEPMTFILTTEKGTRVFEVPPLSASMTVIPKVLRWRVCRGASITDC